MRVRFRWSWAWQAVMSCLVAVNVQAQETGSYYEVVDGTHAQQTAFAAAFDKEPAEAPVPGTQKAGCSSCAGECGDGSCTIGNQGCNHGGGNCGSCGQGCGSRGGCDDIWYDSCSCNKGWGGYIISYGEGFRGPADGTFGGNGGGATGVNLGRQIGDSLWGLQLGGSYGGYDWRGRTSGNEANVQQSQLFFTGGFYKKAACESRGTFGMFYDMMVNDNFGSGSDEPFLTQFRFYLGRAVNEQNEIGFWTNLADRNANQAGRTYRAVNTYNLYLNHKFCGGAQSFSWIGATQGVRIPNAGGGSLYSLWFGNYTIIPITARLAGYTSVMYAIPSSANGVAAARDETYAVQAGIVFYPQRNSRSKSISGQGWMPFAPLASNNNFLVDAAGAP